MVEIEELAVQSMVRACRDALHTLERKDLEVKRMMAELRVKIKYIEGRLTDHLE